MKDLLINNFQKSPSVSYLQTFSGLKNVDTDTVPGVAMVNYELQDNTSGINALSAYTFTANAGTDVLTTSSAHGYFTGLSVQLTTTGTLPGGLSTGTTYYVQQIGGDTGLKIYATLADFIASSEIDILDTGSGTHTITPTQMGYITSIVDRNSSGSYFNRFAIDDNGTVWVHYTDDYWCVLDGNANLEASELVVWKDYLFSIGADKIDVYGKLSDIQAGTPAWTNNWATFTDTAGTRSALAGQDDVVYIGAGKYVASILEKTGTTFDPASGATYTFNGEALDLPDNYQITCLEELGTYLAIGSQLGYNFGAGNVADVFLWDRVSTTFELPVQLKTQGIRSMVNFNNLLYVNAGLRGKIYAVDGRSAQLVGQISPQLVGLQQDSYQLYATRNGMARKGNLILIGATGSAVGSPTGVFSFNPQTGAVALEHTISTGSDGSVATVQVPCIYVDGDSIFYAGVFDDADGYYGIDKLSITRRYSSYDAYIRTGLYRVGVDRRKRVFKHCEVVLAKELATGNAVRVKYRTRLDENFTTIGTMSSGREITIDTNVVCDNIQVQVEMDTSSNTGKTPELLSVRLY